MLATAHFVENEAEYRFKVGDYLDESTHKSSEKIVQFINDVHEFDLAESKKAVSDLKRTTRKQSASIQKAKAKEIDPVDSNVTNVTLTSQSSSSSSSIFTELQKEVSKLKEKLEASKIAKRNVESNRDVSLKFLTSK
jgi:polyhydroxyalkanoate synthesis regulator phasin